MAASLGMEAGTILAPEHIDRTENETFAGTARFRFGLFGECRLMSICPASRWSLA